MECRVMLCGPAGRGLQTMEAETTRLLARTGFGFFSLKHYQSRIRGGHNRHMLRIAGRPVHAPAGDPWDVLVALDDASLERHGKALRNGGILLGPEDMRDMEIRARQVLGDSRAAGRMVSGMILAVLGCDRETLLQATGENGPSAALAGFDWAAGRGLAGAVPVSRHGGSFLRLDGNQALACGALLGGCQFMAGYPMTPATSIMNHVAAASAYIPVHFEQAEDEIAAVNMAVGASFAGLRSLVATSGGGFALMQEGISLAAMTETPLVAIIGQRPGPATGLPTRTEQADLGFVLHAGHGEFPRAIFAPGTIAEALEIMPRAFALADRFQVPVFVLSDQFFADSVHAVTQDLPLVPDRREYAETDADYRRYALTQDGVSPLAAPGGGPAVVRADSDEHDEDGRITEDPDLRRTMVEKRLKKGDGLARAIRPPTVFGNRESPLIAVCWGSTRHVAEEAVERLNLSGRPVMGIHFGQVWPLTPAMLDGIDRRGKTAVCIEQNATGQFAALLARELGWVCAHHIRRYDGDPFTVDELHERLAALPEVSP